MIFNFLQDESVLLEKSMPQAVGFIQLVLHYGCHGYAPPLDDAILLYSGMCTPQKVTYTPSLAL